MFGGLFGRASRHHDSEDGTRGVRGDDPDDLPAVHDRDAIGKPDDLVKLGRHEQNGRSLVPLCDDAFVDEFDGPDVDAARGLVGDEKRQIS